MQTVTFFYILLILKMIATVNWLGIIYLYIYMYTYIFSKLLFFLKGAQPRWGPYLQSIITSNLMKSDHWKYDICHFIYCSLFITPKMRQNVS